MSRFDHPFPSEGTVDQSSQSTDGIESSDQAIVDSKTDVTGLVLAGGESRRFTDGDKALAQLEGESFVGRVTAAIRTVTTSVLVSVGTVDRQSTIDDALSGFDRVRYVTDHDDHKGPLAGIRAGVEAATTPWVVVVACDMPLLDPRCLRYLLSKRDESVDAVVPKLDGHRQPLQVCYRRTALARCWNSVPATAGPQALLDQLSIRTVPTEEVPSDVSIERSLTNINTREDLTELRNRLNRESVPHETEPLAETANLTRPVSTGTGRRSLGRSPSGPIGGTPREDRH